MSATVYGDRENIVIDSIDTHNVIPCTNAIITFTDGTIIHIERNRYSHLWFIHYKKHCKAKSHIDVCGIDLGRTSDIFYTEAVFKSIQNFEISSEV